jgi:hypothetical protein
MMEKKPRSTRLALPPSQPNRRALPAETVAVPVQRTIDALARRSTTQLDSNRPGCASHDQPCRARSSKLDHCPVLSPVLSINQ